MVTGTLSPQWTAATITGCLAELSPPETPKCLRLSEDSPSNLIPQQAVGRAGRGFRATYEGQWREIAPQMPELPVRVGTSLPQCQGARALQKLQLWCCPHLLLPPWRPQLTMSWCALGPSQGPEAGP